ncbi:MAG: translation initiation factor IF-2, partial [Patescibacteria group bacterium]
VLGHIDNGKSTLLDYIRKTNITETDAGGITQHISAYEVVHTAKEGPQRKITFLDTPGHEAFGKMRARGAELADIAILVISAEDGVKAQTLEALKAITGAHVPYIVAITKIDKPNANPEKIKQELSENGVFVEGYGGDIPIVPVSSKTGEGIPLLLDMVILVADLEELSGDVEKPAQGIVLESSINPKTGISATLVIQDGTLERGMYVAAGSAWAPVRRIQNFLGETIDAATFSSPVSITGFDAAPEVGSLFSSFKTRGEAQESAASEKRRIASMQKGKPGARTNAVNEELQTIPVVLKADTVGSLEAIEHEIKKINIPNTEIKIVSRGVGNIGEGDIKALGGAEHALIVGFHVAALPDARNFAETTGTPLETFTIIYELANWLSGEVKKRAPRIRTEERVGAAKIVRFFSRTKDKCVVGGKVVEGKLVSGSTVKILRRDVEIARGKIVELQQQKLKTGEVSEGSEFGALIQSKQDIAPGDVVESFTIVER